MSLKTGRLSELPSPEKPPFLGTQQPGGVNHSQESLSKSRKLVPEIKVLII